MQLVSLANPKMNITDKEILANIIECLFHDIEVGNSCSKINDVALRVNISNEEITQILEASNLVVFCENYPELQAKPISYWSINGSVFLYISRYLKYEMQIASDVTKLISPLENVNNTNKEMVFDKLEQLCAAQDLPNIAQLSAIKHSCNNRFSIITGGPGTGKTTTVTLLLWALYQIYGQDVKVRIAAPTGKAALRVYDSMKHSIESLSEYLGTDCFNQLMDNKNLFSTIHKLLGTKFNNIYFNHNKINPLDVEILIIDESSMVGLPLFSKLLEALDDSKLLHIVFLGDKNQLSSVEEGYVFASLVDFSYQRINYQAKDLFDTHEEVKFATNLLVGKRSGEVVNNLANAVLLGNNTQIEELLKKERVLKDPRLHDIITQNMTTSDEYNLAAYMTFLQNLQSLGVMFNERIHDIFASFTSSVNLCMTNVGVLGTENLNRELESQIKRKYIISSEWYTGRAIMIQQNDYINNLFNGDIGICLIDDGVPRVYFANGMSCIPELLPKYTLAYAITIHKSQGSEYKNVNIILPTLSDDTNSSNLLNKNLIYTAITRAKAKLVIFAELETVLVASGNYVFRNSGLQNLLDAKLSG